MLLGLSFPSSACGCCFALGFACVAGWAGADQVRGVEFGAPGCDVGDVVDSGCVGGVTLRRPPVTGSRVFFIDGSTSRPRDERRYVFMLSVWSTRRQ